MKKSLLLSTAALTLTLAACTETAEPAEGSKDTSSMTLEEVYSMALEKNNEIESVKSSAILNQAVIMGSEDETIHTTSEIDMTVVSNPLTLHQVNTTEMSGGEGTEAPNQSFTVESYMTEDGFYMQDPASSQWLKMPAEMSDQLIQMSHSQSNPGSELENLEAYIEDFTFEQNDDSFILTLNASGEKFSDMLIEQTGELMPDLGLGIPAETLFKDTTFEDVLYVITLDKESFLIESLDLDMTMNMNFAEQSMKIEQNLESDYTDYNAIDEITVPQEVIDSAEEISM
ncbi:DUF6612 family protein [Jeotgalibacillus salarius]|uniref:LppX_LprAFG lipoprotein n=1 Tax=Jeotgalibacillus salarius TaxID=546023 RepID=A0A4Y8L6G4_9BACL|nr:DUF6612 family protein [Jeotgalibacillus salarius]TFD98249.1 hypothetical protein E2626_15885 [Jeotgalibacillus salarius]